MASINQQAPAKKPNPIIAWIAKRKITVMLFGFLLYLLLGDANSIFTQVSLHNTRMEMEQEKQVLLDRISKNEAYLEHLRTNSEELVSPNFPILPFKKDNEILFIFQDSP